MKYEIAELIKRYPSLDSCKDSILDSLKVLKDCYKSGHKLLIAGNGGSSADADHIVGELMKSFKECRKVDSDLLKEVSKYDVDLSKCFENSLQKGLPAIALHNHNGLNTAFINDVANGGELMYAQQLLVYGEKDDVFLAISTSGNSKNVYAAAVLAKAKGMKVVSLTGEGGGKLAKLADIAIKAPTKETFIVQEYHLPIYHFLCLNLEEEFFY